MSPRGCSIRTMAAPLVQTALWLLSGAASAPALIFSAEVALSSLPKQKTRQPSPPNPLRLAVLVPAHNEAAGIGATVVHLQGQLGPTDRLLVIADNCTDDTADVASALGAIVLRRTDPERRGKGYALSFGADALRDAPPDVVIIMDADCRVQRGSLRSLAELAVHKHRPTQAVYLMDRPENGSPLAGISAFAFLVRNWLRPLGLKRLGFPCLLTGTGMAFPWEIYRDAPPTHSFLVEDLLLGHELAIRGMPPLLDEATIVNSELPVGDAASFKQRRRWEHGQLSVLKEVTPRLLSEGVKQGRAGLVALAVDGFVPPLALLVFLQSVAVIGLVIAGFLGATWGPAALAGATLSWMGMSVLWAWSKYGRALVRGRDLLFIPKYILWKIPLYRTFARSGAHGEWERTER
jgi:cellulose synthase/poly-beta-1,6-N-acetylglucosamine synthase-like glycosyltransferase